MIFLVLVVVVMVGLRLVYKSALVDKASRNDPYMSNGWSVVIVSTTLALIAGVVSLFVATITSYTAQVSNHADLDRLANVIDIQEERSEAITSEIKGLLVERYPAYERSVINDVMETDPTLILLRFPELEASTTMVKYVDQVVGLRGRVYDLRERRQAVQRDIDRREANDLLYLTFLLP